MRIGIAVDFGKYAKASSLDLIARKIFLELGRLMNEKRNFTVTALLYENLGIGDMNQHYDCISIPNMGGYRFPRERALTSNNLFIGLSGIDEVVLGQEVYKTKTEWNKNRILIEKEVPKWFKLSSSIRLIHVPSYSDKEQMIKYLKIPEEKISVIYHGVDHEKFKPSLNKESDRRVLSNFFMIDSPYFIHISESNWARKNVFRLIEAYEIARKNGIKHKLILVGRSESKVYKRANRIEGVKVLGYVSEELLIKLIQCADVLVFPSLHEGFGLPLVEAMACGVPVVTSNVFSPPEIVQDAGLFVNPHEVSDIAAKLTEMSENNILRDELGKKALERAKRFSWNKAASELLDLIKQNSRYDYNNFDFNENYDIAAYRTLATICQISPDLYKIFAHDLLKFDYSKIIKWSIESGLEDPTVKDFLYPFKEWLISHN